MLAGIILIGGKSSRMGETKALLEFRGETLLERTAQLLSNCCSKVYVSGKEDQKLWAQEHLHTFIADTYPEIGPVAGILSAFESNELAGQALLVATDMPLVDADMLKQLLIHRDVHKKATMFADVKTGFLEPLCAIYEPSAYTEIKKAVENKEYSLQRIFERDHLNLLELKIPLKLKNINTPEELAELIQQNTPE
jgi:molybdenum cofactor guanylyltransferase